MRKNKEESFFEKVYTVARLIPKGRVTTYGAIAKYLASGKSARMVGWAMNNSFRLFPLVPAQRVVNRVGLLTGRHHFAYPGQMEELLEKEGIEIVNYKVRNFNSVFWNPLTELPPFEKLYL